MTTDAVPMDDDLDVPEEVPKVVGVRAEGLIRRTAPVSLSLNDDHPMLLTGSSGSGKSTLLRGIHAVATGNFPLLSMLPLQRLTLEREHAPDIVSERTDLGVTLRIGDDVWDYEIGDADSSGPSEERWRHTGTSRLLRMDGAVISRAEYEALREYFADRVAGEAPWVIEQLSDLAVPYIADDRLFALAEQDVPSPIDSGASSRRSRGPQVRTDSFRSIDLVGGDLRVYCRDRIVGAQHYSAQIDRHLPERVVLAAREGSATAEEVSKKSQRIESLHQRMDAFGMNSSPQSVPEPLEESGDERERAVLLAVLESYEEKLAASIPLLEDLERFVNAVNRRFRHKSLQVSVRRGMRVLLDEEVDGAEGDEEDRYVPLSMLSSGEQHLVVLLYRLIFGSRSGSLFLVDEPELSMHVAWQRELASDLAEIAAHKDSRYLIATHSPAVVAGHLDWEVNFDDLED